MSSNICAQTAKSPCKQIPTTVSGFEHQSTSMLAACYAAQHMCMASLAWTAALVSVFCLKWMCQLKHKSIPSSKEVGSSSLEPKCLHIRLKCFMLSNTSTAKIGNVLCLSLSSNFKRHLAWKSVLPFSRSASPDDFRVQQPEWALLNMRKTSNTAHCHWAQASHVDSVIQAAWCKTLAKIGTW